MEEENEELEKVTKMQGSFEEKLGTMVRRERERVREAEAEHRQGEEKQYKQARRDEEGVEAEAERLVKEENRHQQAAGPKEL